MAEAPERLVAKVGGFVIGHYEYGYTVAPVVTARKGKNAGQKYVGSASYFPTLASACAWAAQRIADKKIAKGLEAYALELNKAINSLIKAVKGSNK